MMNCEIFKNNCTHRDSDGFCYKCECGCPTTLKVDKDNNNNAPCDMVSYVDKTGENI